MKRCDLLVLTVTCAAALACGPATLTPGLPGASQASSPDAPQAAAQTIAVVVQPSAVQVRAQDRVTFAATAFGTGDERVTWSVREAGGGAVDANGVYSAPASPGVYHVVAVSAAAPDASAEAAVTVFAAGTVTAGPSVESFAASAPSVARGASTTLSWSVVNATAVSITPGVGPVTGTSAVVTPAATTTYTLVATSATGATTTASTTVLVVPPPAIAAFTASPSTVAPGEQATLSWTVSDATAVSISPGVGAVTGTSVTVSPAATTTYTLTARNLLTSVTATTTVTVSGTVAAPPSIASFSASPASVTAGSASTLSWRVTGATSLSIDQGVGDVTGTSVAVSPGSTTTYTLTATGPGGSATATATVSVTADPPAPRPSISSFSASPSTITPGSSSTLSWSVSGATSLSIDRGVGSVSGSSVVVQPSSTTTYTLTASNAAGSSTASVSVTVAAPPPPPPPTGSTRYGTGGSHGASHVSVSGGGSKPSLSGARNVLDYGARGDCSSDDRSAFQSAANAAGSGVVLVPAPPGSCYRISDTVELKGSLIGDGYPVVRLDSDVDHFLFKTYATSGAWISGIQFQGGWNGQYPGGVEPPQDHTAIAILGGGNYTIQDNSFDSFQGDAVYLSNSDNSSDPAFNVRIDSNTMRNLMRCGAAMINVDGILITNNDANKDSTNPWLTIFDMEPNTSSQRIDNVEIAYNKTDIPSTYDGPSVGFEVVFHVMDFSGHAFGSNAYAHHNYGNFGQQVCRSCRSGDPGWWNGLASTGNSYPDGPGMSNVDVSNNVPGSSPP